MTEQETKMIPISYLLLEDIQVNPQLCYEDINKFIEVTNDKDLYWSPKIDGVRCWVIINHDGKIRYVSRNNKEFFNFSVFNKEIIELIKESRLRLPIIFDCEAASTNKKLNQIMTQLRRINNVDVSKIRLHIFNTPLVGKHFKETHNIVKKSFQGKKFKYLKYLPYLPFKYTPNKLESLVNDQVRKGYEGVVLQYGKAIYQFGKRTKWCCKVKKMKTIDLKVIDIEMGKKGSKLEGMMSKFIVDYNGRRLPISGRISNKQRIEFAKNPPINKFIEIRYQEKTPNGSLRITTYIRMRGDK